MTDLVDYLRQRLTEPLPGETAQALMMPTLSSRSRFSIESKKDARPGGVMIMLFQKEGEWYFPLIQRPDYDGVHAKQMSFPGGKMDETDPDLIYTGMRELREEIGVEISNDNVIGQLTELYIIASNFNVTPSIAVYPEVPEYIQDEYEVDEIIEVKVGDLMNDKIIRKKPIRISYGINIQAPYFDLNNKVVWGATAMILSEFKTILKPYFIGQG